MNFMMLRMFFVRWATLPLLMVALLSCSASGHKEAEDKSVAVFVHPDINVSAYLDAASAGLSLSEQLKATWLFSVAMKNSSGNASNTVDSCSSALAADSSGDRPLEPSVFTTFQYAVAQCLAVRWAAQLKAGKQSFLADFTMDVQSIKALPISLFFEASATEKKRLELKYKHIGDLAEPQQIETLNPYEATLAVPGGEQSFKLLGRGDLNEDGIEDIILQITNSLTEGSFRASSVYALTRLSANTEIILLDNLE